MFARRTDQNVHPLRLDGTLDLHAQCLKHRGPEQVTPPIEDGAGAERVDE
jgi:hypothetical protein